MKWSMVIAVMLAAASVADAAEPGQLPVIHLEMHNDDPPQVSVLRSEMRQ